MSASALSSLVFLGLLSALAPGPASFSIFRKLLTAKSWPRGEIVGFLLGDLIYVSASLFLLKSPLLEETRFKTALTLFTCATFLLFSFHLLKKKPDPLALPPSSKGFWGSLLLTLGNFHLPLLYTGLFASLLSGSLPHMAMGAGLYALSFSIGFILLLVALKNVQGSLQKRLRHMEVAVSFGFIFFSLYLSWRTL